MRPQACAAPGAGAEAATTGGMAGTAAGARSGKYPLARYLYMFTNGWPEGDVLDFINYMQSPAGQKIVNSTGFVSLQEMK